MSRELRPLPSGPGIFGFETKERDAWLHLLPVPWDATTSYQPGTSNGPEAIRQASIQVDLFDWHTRTSFVDGVYMFPVDGGLKKLNTEARILKKAGQVHSVNQKTAEMNRWVYENVKASLEANKQVGIIGGDHSVPQSAIRALGEQVGEFGVLHLDAHADLREAYEGFHHSHASIMFNVMKECPHVQRLVQVGIRDFCEEEFQMIELSKGRIVPFFDEDIANQMAEGKSWKAVTTEILKQLPSQVYVSFDIDGLEPSLCPNTGTPVLGGLSAVQIRYLLRALKDSGKTIVGFDLCEVAPHPDGLDQEWNANVGARMLFLLCQLLRSQK